MEIVNDIEINAFNDEQDIRETISEGVNHMNTVDKIKGVLIREFEDDEVKIYDCSSTREFVKQHEEDIDDISPLLGDFEKHELYEESDSPLVTARVEPIPSLIFNVNSNHEDLTDEQREDLDIINKAYRRKK